MPHCVLLIQSDAVGANSVRNALISFGDNPFQVEWVGFCSQGVERLEQESTRDNTGVNTLEAVLVDLFLPDSQGIETFDRIFRAAPHIPILVLCTSHHEDIARAAMQRGAQDYLLKARVDSYLLPKTLRNMIDRAVIAEALFEEKERAQVTLNSIGDAVMSSDLQGRVTYLNSVAEHMTGWSLEEATGHPVDDVFHIVDADTRMPAPSPMALATSENKTITLTSNCVLVRRDGVEAAVEDSAAPVHDRRGRVVGAVMVFHDVSTTRALSLRMSYMAQHDILTELPNRAVLTDRLTQAIALADRRRQSLAVLFLDLDYFKNINDTLGHEIGDRLLQSVAQRLRSCVRGSDTVSRLGGDEFVILLAEVVHAHDAAVCAEKILLALSAPHRIEQHSLEITGSIGIVTHPDDGADAGTLMKHADIAMYRAKGCGRNNYRFFEPEMNAHALERQSLHNGLRHAVELQQLVLHYQPILNLKTQAIVGAEALVRWNHPKRGLVFPGQFVPDAEESGFIVAIGRWVLREACRQTRLWRDSGLPAIRISVNISEVELRDKNFIAGVRAILTETGLEPNSLELELTETFLMEDPTATAKVLHELKDVGVRLALDDFGTGYSSLSHLKGFPIDTLKIDQAFVRDIATGASDAIIVGLVIRMGKSLDMRVVAEGVETRDELKALRKHGCPEGQGYYFAKPIPAEEFEDLLRSFRPARRTSKKFQDIASLR